jgi:hypothetical protein
MGDPRHVRPDEVEILVARELRKAGVELSRLRVVARRPGVPPDDGSTYVIELDGVTPAAEAPRAVLVEFRNQATAVDVTGVRALLERNPMPPDADAPKRLQPRPAPPPPAASVSDAAAPPLRVMFSTSGFEAAAAREALSLGVRLLRVADGPAAFRRSQWAVGEQPPAWVPEYMAEAVDLGPGGEVRYQLLTGKVGF